MCNVDLLHPEPLLFFNLAHIQLGNLFFVKLKVLKLRHNHSQSPVFGLAVLYLTGSEISRFWYIKTRGRKILFFAFLISTFWRFYRANEKKSVTYTLKMLKDL